jgi:quercetin dioxygenase-like cupin family protein
MLSRRDVLATAAAGAALSATSAGAASFGNPDEPPQGAINAKNPASITDPGPQDPAIRNQLQSAFTPPATDVGSMPQIWASFNTAPRRIQDGGWARQVTQADFPISTTIASVNMRLTAGGIRELHWHQAAEWAYVTYGNCRVTVLDTSGRPYVADVKEGDIWYFPTGYLHSLQGLGPDGCEFVVCFDNGAASGRPAGRTRNKTPARARGRARGRAPAGSARSGRPASRRFAAHALAPVHPTDRDRGHPRGDAAPRRRRKAASAIRPARRCDTRARGRADRPAPDAPASTNRRRGAASAA